MPKSVACSSYWAYFHSILFLSAELHSPGSTVGEIVLADWSVSIVKILIYHSMSIPKMFKGDNKCEISLSMEAESEHIDFIQIC